MAVSVAETMRSINAACRSQGGRYKGYECQVVSWDDVGRGTVSGQLSCWGANITDTYLKSKDGTQLFTVRPNNWNEKLGRVTSSEVALVAGGCGREGGPLKPVTLREFLKNISKYGAYAGLPAGADLSDAALDERCSIRFQTTFLPVSGVRGSMEFATEAYNYNTQRDDDPRNLVLLCTSQGVALQQDGSGAKRLFHHAVDEDGTIHRYWLEAERSEHKVGGEQKETAVERADAVNRGKATASVIGTRAMGTRFNVLMTIQEPIRHSSESVTVTVVIYNTVANGVPSQEDVLAAIDDLEELYTKCDAWGRRADAAFDFANKELTVGDLGGIATKIVTQPYKPQPEEVVSYDTFPC